VNVTMAADSARQVVVTNRGLAVMPFDLKATIHIFTKTLNGGIQQVIARKANDTAQVRLAREHLKEIAARYSKGDFSGPTYIHGADMPGLNEIKKAKPGSIKFQYREIKSGAELRYATDNPKLSAAIHRYFDAQLSDHGDDAMAGHNHSMMHMHQ